MDNELLCLLRQFRHNNSDEFVSGFDRDGVIALVSGLRAELAEYKRDAERLDSLEQMQQGVYPVTERVRVPTTTTELRYADEWRFVGWSVSGRLDELPTIRDAIDALAAKGE